MPIWEIERNGKVVGEIESENAPDRRTVLRALAAIDRQSVLPKTPSQPAAPVMTEGEAIRNFSRNTLTQLFAPFGRAAAPKMTEGVIRGGQYVKDNPKSAGAMLAAGLLTSGTAPAAIAIPQAALYGAAGAGAGAVAERLATPGSQPLDVSDTLGSMAEEGAIQGVAQGAGAALQEGAKRSGRWLMNRALNLTERLSQEFPEMSQTMIDHAITVSKGGLRRARALLLAGKAEANAAVRAADQAGVRVPISAATNGLNKTLDVVAKGADREGGLRALVQVENQIRAGRGAAMTVAEADALKTSLQTESRNLYRQIARGDGRPAVTVAAQAKADMAAALNEAIESATKQVGAGTYRSGNAAAQDMIGVTRGIRRGIRPGSNLYQAMVRPGAGAVLGGIGGYNQGGGAGAVGGALAGAVATSPGTMSREALILTNPLVQKILSQLPRATAAAIEAELAQPANPSAGP